MEFKHATLFENIQVDGISQNFDKVMILNRPTTGQSMVTDLTKQEDTLFITVTKDKRDFKVAVPWVHVKVATLK